MPEHLTKSRRQRNAAVACLAAICSSAGVLAGVVPGGDRFGESVDLSGDTAVIGRPSARPGTGPDTGAALVYVLLDGAWRLQSSLASEPAAVDGFGAAVAISGPLLAVAAPFAIPPAVHVFERQGNHWLHQARVEAPQPNVGFGAAIALDAGTLLVGARFRGGSRGGVYVFERSGTQWQLATTLVASDADADDEFGGAVALDATRAVVGATGHGFGAAYIFDRSNGLWTESQRVQADGGQLGDNFGQAVAVAGDRVVVGAPGTEAEDFEHQGSAVVFERGTGGWAQTAELSAFDGRDNDLFGWSLSLDGDTLIAGAIFDTDSVEQQGSAYAFTHVAGTWVSSVKLRAMQARPSEIFGNAVALEGDRLWIGAPGFQNDSFGTAHAFERSGLLWNLGERFVDPLLFADQFEAH